jgi:inner membrane protein
MVAAQGEMYVQLWLRPGDPPVEVTLGEDKPESVIPEVLRTYL